MGEPGELPSMGLHRVGHASTSADLDGAVQAIAEALPLMLELAEVEKSTARLADEIEKTRRRVNALEYVMIPSTPRPSAPSR